MVQQGIPPPLSKIHLHDIMYSIYRSHVLIMVQIMGMYSAIAFAVEIESRFISNSFLFESVVYLNSLLPFQRVMLVRAIPPALGLMLNLLCVNFYTDTEKLNQYLWQSAVSTNRIIMEKMADVVEATSESFVVTIVLIILQTL